MQRISIQRAGATSLRIGGRARVAPSTALRSHGFSLIEILVVMALIGIVIALVANRMVGGREKGMEQAAKIGADNLAQKIEMYTLDNGAPPAQLEDLMNKPGTADNWNGPYAREKDLQDPWKRRYAYRTPGEKSGGDYDVYSLGSDGKEGQTGDKGRDVGNW